MRATVQLALLAMALLLTQACGDNGQPSGQPDASDGSTSDVTNPVKITTTSLPNGPAGQPYQAPVAATGGTPPYAWSIVNGPAWLTISQGTGTLGGTPTTADAGGVDVTVRVVDSQQQTDTHSYHFTITTCTQGTVTCYAGDTEAGTGECYTGTATCAADGTQGPCSPIAASTDPAHCGGACGTCSTTTADGCTNGACSCGSSPECTGTSDCCSGSCFDLQSDPQHCGKCTGGDCTSNPPAHSVAGCTAGQCDYSQCDPGYADCDGVPGCECGAQSAADHATGSCPSAGVCAHTCDPGWLDCTTPGLCDTPTNTDAHCGSCNACPPNETCNGTSCTCASPNKVCNGSCIDVLTDANNCGVCGNVCSTTTIGSTGCQNGFCVCPNGQGPCPGPAYNYCTTAYPNCP